MSGKISDWRRAHAELLRIAAERVALDRDEGQWLIAAQRAGVHRRLGFATFAEYVERVLGYGPRTTDDKLRVAAARRAIEQARAHVGAGVGAGVEALLRGALGVLSAGSQAA